MKVYIKNMVCDRCKMAVKTEFERLGLDPYKVELGEVELAVSELPQAIAAQLESNLEKLGFAMLNDQKDQLVAKIKSAIVDLVHHKDHTLKTNLSDYLSEKLDFNYAHLSAVFSEKTGTTVEKYMIIQKIEKAKELLTYGERSLSEISFLLNYSSVAHLSTQFKKITGVTPSSFKLAANKNRKTLDQL